MAIIKRIYSDSEGMHKVVFQDGPIEAEANITFRAKQAFDNGVRKFTFVQIIGARAGRGLRLIAVDEDIPEIKQRLRLSDEQLITTAWGAE